MFTVTVRFLPGGYKTVTCHGATPVSEILASANANMNNKWTVRDESSNVMQLTDLISSKCTLKATPASGMKGN